MTLEQPLLSSGIYNGNIEVYDMIAIVNNREIETETSSGNVWSREYRTISARDFLSENRKKYGENVHLHVTIQGVAFALYEGKQCKGAREPPNPEWLLSEKPITIKYHNGDLSHSVEIQYREPRKESSN